MYLDQSQLGAPDRVSLEGSDGYRWSLALPTHQSSLSTVVASLEQVSSQLSTLNSRSSLLFDLHQTGTGWIRLDLTFTVANLEQVHHEQLCS